VERSTIFKLGIFLTISTGPFSIANCKRLPEGKCTNKQRFLVEPCTYWCVLRRVAGWVAGGCWDDDITSDEMDHSRKFPTFSTSKLKILRWLSLFFIWQGKITDVSLRWSTDPYQWEIFQRSRGTSDCFSECWWRSPSAWHHVVFLFFFFVNWRVMNSKHVGLLEGNILTGNGYSAQIWVSCSYSREQFLRMAT